jgi:hypothetical protein
MYPWCRGNRRIDSTSDYLESCTQIPVLGCCQVKKLRTHAHTVDLQNLSARHSFERDAGWCISRHPGQDRGLLGQRVNCLDVSQQQMKSRTAAGAPWATGALALPMDSVNPFADIGRRHVRETEDDWEDLWCVSLT